MNETTIAVMMRALAPIITEVVERSNAPLLRRIEELEQRPPIIGERGEKGENGRDGKDADEKAIAILVAQEVKKSVEALPKAKDGENGRDGIAKDGAKGEAGKDGVGISDGFIDGDGTLILTFSDGRTKTVGRVRGKDGERGPAGENANTDAFERMLAGLSKSEKAFDPEMIKSLIPAPQKGDTGSKGERGDSGESAYQIAVRIGFKGSEPEWLKSLKGDAGSDGRDGKDAKEIDFSRVESEIEKRVGEIVKKIPAPKDGKDGRDGKDGKDGKDVDEPAIKSALQTELRAMFESIPAPKDGKDGRDGKDGESPDPLAIERTITDRVEKAVKAIPAPNDGKDGKEGASGVSIKDVATDSDGCLLVTLSSGDILRTKSVRGEDGLGFDDMRVESDGERTFKVIFERGDRIKKYELTIPSVIYRDVWEAAEKYAEGDCVTYGGSLWVAKREAEPNERPDQSDAWRLAVKRGRDGRPGKDGEKGDKGPEGRPGKDLTQMGPDGARW